ncbi:MAG TPA: type I methionyl aminopeptidase [Capsulimonadaceae bacterium]|jgi:methionyl aminopeptidase
MNITIKTKDQIELMRIAGRAVAAALEAMKNAIDPGNTSTADLDNVAAETLKQFGATSSLLNYKPSFSDVAYLHTTCISVNNEVVHGVPSASRILKEGDIVGLDLDAAIGGWVADSAITVPVGRVSASAANLITVTRDAMYKAIAQAKVGNRTGDIGAAMQRHCERSRYNVVRECQGHGIGQTPHEGPDVPCFGKPGKGTLLRPGMTICIEPMVNAGTWRLDSVPGDPWTLVTGDGSLSAHFEHTVAITDDGPDILTKL